MDAAGLGIRIDEGALRHAVQQAAFGPEYLDEERWTSGEGFVRDALLEEDRVEVATDIDAKAKKLAGMLVSAVRAGMTVRWFSVDHVALDGREKWEASSRPGVVSLANAVEVEVRPVPDGWETAVLFATMRYSVQNRRALATLLWETEHSGHFVVWSDGDGTGCRLEALPWQRIAGMTAPHHGSDKSVHDPIWDAAAPHLAGLDVVLAGGTASQSLHGAFTAHAVGSRACTSCGKCRAAQARPRPKVHAATHAEVAWPRFAATCATACGCPQHP